MCLAAAGGMREGAGCADAAMSEVGQTCPVCSVECISAVIAAHQISDPEPAFPRGGHLPSRPHAVTPGPGPP